MKTEIPFDLYEKKIHGAWLGKSIGGAIGAALESHKERKDLTMDRLWPEDIPPNDDMDIQIVWLEALQEKGPYLTQDDLVHYWQDRCWYNFCEYGFFLYNVQRGIKPPLSGIWDNDFYKESEGCPIRSDIWGLVSPGNPELAAALAKNDGELDHTGFSVQAEMFYAAMTAQALVGGTLEDLLTSGFSVLPEDSPIRDTVTTIRKIHGEVPDFPAAWRVLMRRYGDRDASKAVTNLAIIMLALLRSDGDFGSAILHCANSGWDTDCTAATLGAILGAWKGPDCIPEEWRSKLPSDLLCGVEIEHKNTPLLQLSHETALLGVEMALTRNHKISILHAPAVIPRSPAPPAVRISAEYPQGPVLYAQKSTAVTLKIFNPMADDVSGTVRITPPENVICTPAEFPCSAAAASECTMELTIRRRDPKQPLPDKNLFSVEFTADNGRIFRDHFGLAGARQWLVYGPYWDMYDRNKYGDKCPYLYPKIIHPAYAGLNSDAFCTHVFPDHPYLDEEALRTADLPEEMPCYLETPHDLIRDHEFDGWHGPCCRYLVREFILPEGEQVVLNPGRTGYLKIWLDDQEIDCGSELHSWMLEEKNRFRFTGTGKKQRLVVKLLNPTDEAVLAIYFHRGISRDPKRGISYLTDTLVNIIPDGYDL